MNERTTTDDDVVEALLDAMTEADKAVRTRLGRPLALVTLAFPEGMPGLVTYASNLPRESRAQIAAALREVLERWERQSG